MISTYQEQKGQNDMASVSQIYQKNMNCGDLGIEQVLPVKQIREHENSVDGLATTPHNEKQFASCSHDHTIKIWDGTKMTCTNTFKRAHDGGVWSLQYDRPTGTKLISCSPDSKAKIWDVKSGKAVITFSGHSHYCYKACFDNDAEHVATVGADKVMNYWDIRSTKAPIFKMEDSPSCLMGVDFMPNDQQIITTSMTGEISIYSVKRQERVYFHETLQDKIENLVRDKRVSQGDDFTPADEKMIRTETKNIMYNVHTVKGDRDEEGVFLVGMLDGEVNKIKADFDKIQIVDQFHGHSDGVRTMEVNKTGDKMISCCADHSLRIWDYKTCKAKLLLAGHTDVVTGGSFLNANTVITASWDMRINVYNV